MISARADTPFAAEARLPKRLVEYIGLITVCVATPFYETAIQLSGKFPLTTAEALLAVFVLQVAVPALLVIVYASAGRRGGRIVDIAVIALTLATLARLMQGRWLTETALPLKVVAVLAFLALTLLLVVKRRAIVSEWLHAVGLLSPIAAVWFVAATTGSAKLPPVSSASATPPVVILMFDELSLPSLLRGDRIDRERFPNFARLSEQSWWLRNATTNFTHTNYSVPSLLAGSLSAGSAGLMERTPRPNLMSLLDPRIGVMALNSLSFKCPRGMPKCSEAAPGQPLGIEGPVAMFLSRLVPSALQWRLIPGTNVFSAWERMRPISLYADEIAPGGFYFLHSMATHFPAMLTPDGRAIALSGPLPYDRDRSGHLIPASPLVRARMADQLRYADRELGRIIDGMRRNGTWDSATVVVIADHGSCWSRTCNRVFPGDITEIEPNLLQIPFLIKSPAAPPRIDDRPAQLVDLLPTLTTLLDLPAGRSGRADGVDLSREPGTRPRKACIAERFDDCRFIAIPDRFERSIPVLKSPG